MEIYQNKKTLAKRIHFRLDVSVSGGLGQYINKSGVGFENVEPCL